MSQSPLLAPTPRARVLLGQLTAAIRAARFYPADHPLVERLVSELLGTLWTYHAEGAADVTLTFHGGEVILGDRVLTEESMLFDQLARELSALGANSIAFHAGVTDSELARLVSLIASGGDALAEQGGLTAAVERAGLSHIDIAAVSAWAPGMGHYDDQETPRRSPEEAYEAALGAVRDIGEAMNSGLPPDTTGVRSAVFSLLDNVISSRQAMVELAGVERADDVEYDHAVNVAVLALAIGSDLTDDPRFLDGLGVGALLHDVGKFEAPAQGASVGPAPDIREHPALGAARTARLSGLDRAAVVVIYEHHQGADGSGYPTPAPGHRQSLAARIVAVADAFDRLTVSSGDAPRLPPEQALVVLAGRAGRDLDEDVVRLFVRQTGVFPRHSVVRLTSAEAAIVLEAGPDPVRPVVRVITTPTGTPLSEPRRVDLAEGAPGGPSVAASLDVSAAGIDIEEYL